MQGTRPVPLAVGGDVEAVIGVIIRTYDGAGGFITTPCNCSTGVPIPAAALEGLFTFHKDGAMSVWAQNATITATRSPSHGLWRREHGRNDYAFKFVHLRYHLATGVFLGRQESSGTLDLGENGDEFTSDSFTVVFDANGNPGPPGCANSVGIRFEIDE
jgi:hypothetical protein